MIFAFYTDFTKAVCFSSEKKKKSKDFFLKLWLPVDVVTLSSRDGRLEMDGGKCEGAAESVQNVCVMGNYSQGGRGATAADSW